jgi:hypothetical protein
MVLSKIDRTDRFESAMRDAAGTAALCISAFVRFIRALVQHYSLVLLFVDDGGVGDAFL